MVPEPRRLRIKRAICRALEEIQPGDGEYFWDLRPTDGERHVWRGRVIFGDDTPLPAVTILEVPLQPDQRASSAANPARNGPWELLLQGFVADDLDNPTDPAEYLMADVVARLAKAKREINQPRGTKGFLNMQYVTDIRIGQGVARPPDEVSNKAYFWVPITLDVVEDMSNPYG